MNLIIYDDQIGFWTVGNLGSAIVGYGGNMCIPQDAVDEEAVVFSGVRSTRIDFTETCAEAFVYIWVGFTNGIPLNIQLLPYLQFELNQGNGWKKFVLPRSAFTIGPLPYSLGGPAFPSPPPYTFDFNNLAQMSILFGGSSGVQNAILIDLFDASGNEMYYIYPNNTFLVASPTYLDLVETLDIPVQTLVTVKSLIETDTTSILAKIAQVQQEASQPHAHFKV